MTNTSTVYFNSRPAAREEARHNPNATFKDFGRTAPKGKRWANIVTASVKMPSKAKVKAAKKAESGPTKKELVIALLKKKGVTERKVALPLLMDELGLSHHCANTYFYNVKTGKWS